MDTALLEQAISHLEAVDQYDRLRWDVIRRGRRDTIPTITRHLVARRDNDRCVECARASALQVDHIMPWSAGGPDTSDNLRMLCEVCNASRSNFVEAWMPHVQPVIVVCDPCLATHHEDAWRVHHRTTYWRHCPLCLGDDWASTDTRRTAWCGTCTAVSWTSDPGRLL